MEMEEKVMKKKKINITYLVAVIIFVVAVAWVIGMSSGQITAYVDFVSLIIILMMTIPMLAASGLGRDFLKSFSLMFESGESVDKAQARRSAEAVGLVMKLALLSGLMATLATIVAILSLGLEGGFLQASLSVSMLTALYALVIDILLLPVQTKLKLQADK